LGDRRRSLRRLPPLTGLTSLQDLSIIETGITDLSPLLELPGLTSLNLSGTPVWDLQPLARLTELRWLSLRMTNVIDLSPLAHLKHLRFLALEGIQCADLRPLAGLTQLTTLLLSGSGISDLTPLQAFAALEKLNLSNTDIVDISALYQLNNLRSLDLSRMNITSLSPLSALTSLRNLNVSYTSVHDLSPLAACTQLESLDLTRTRVTRLAPLIGLGTLHTLVLDFTPIEILAPLANLTSLARRGHYFFDDEGLSFAGCPIRDSVLVRFARLHNPDRTISAINHIRGQQGLTLLTEEECLKSDQKYLPRASASEDIQPLDNVASAFDFRLTSRGTIALSSSSSNWPVFSHKSSQQDHASRLDTCRTLANDLISDLRNRKFQARGEYLEGLSKYSSRLPVNPGEGNIFLAESEARTLRNLFAAETNILSPPFASQLKTFLEQHIGLRVFYPEIARFYRDVQTGRIESSLSLDAVEGFIRGVKTHTPTVFDPSVNETMAGSSSEPSAELSPTDQPSGDSNQPLPPRDPLGELDPQKSHDFTFAGTANALWKAFIQGEKVYNAVASWQKAGQSIRPYAYEILAWLHRFTGQSSDPPQT
jgi:Leucine-rich repeat (LRR) protein